MASAGLIAAFHARRHMQLIHFFDALWRESTRNLLGSDLRGLPGPFLRELPTEATREGVDRAAAAFREPTEFRRVPKGRHLLLGIASASGP